MTRKEWAELVMEEIDNLEQSSARWHIVGCLWGQQAGHEEMHLWEWTGEELTLIVPGYREVIY